MSVTRSSPYDNAHVPVRQRAAVHTEPDYLPAARLMGPSGNVRTDIDETRYPRPLWLRALRWGLRLWWLGFSPYATVVVPNLYLALAHASTDWRAEIFQIAQALLLDRVLPLLAQQPAKVVPFLVAAVFFVWFGHWAHHDQEKERAVLARCEARERHIQERAAINAAFKAMEQAISGQIVQAVRDALSGLDRGKGTPGGENDGHGDPRLHNPG